MCDSFKDPVRNVHFQESTSFVVVDRKKKKKKEKRYLHANTEFRHTLSVVHTTLGGGFGISRVNQPNLSCRIIYITISVQHNAKQICLSFAHEVMIRT